MLGLKEARLVLLNQTSHDRVGDCVVIDSVLAAPNLLLELN